jgi:hypothetical protein
MKDRVSSKVLDNGAIRYGVYDENGNLEKYQYMKLEDEPVEEGSALNKANLLPDEVCAALNLSTDAEVKDALSELLSNIGSTSDALTELINNRIEDFITIGMYDWGGSTVSSTDKVLVEFDFEPSFVIMVPTNQYKKDSVSYYYRNYWSTPAVVQGWHAIACDFGSSFGNNQMYGLGLSLIGNQLILKGTDSFKYDGVAPRALQYIAFRFPSSVES